MKPANSLLLFLFLSLPVLANEGPPTSTEWRTLAPSDGVATTVPTPMLRDPFSEPQISYNNGQMSAFSEAGMGGFGSGFQRGRGDFRVPELVFRGFIDSAGDEPPMALIQIGKSKVHMVREGDEINIDPTQPRNAIRITNINRLSITVETGVLGTMRVLR